MAVSATIGELIEAAANGASAGVATIREADLAIELSEFEIEVTYGCTTQFDVEAELEAKVKFTIFESKFTVRTAYRNTQSYGLKVRFLFTGDEQEEA